MTAFCSKSFGALTSCCFLCNVVVIVDPFEHFVYFFDSESDLLVPQLMSQLVMRPEFHNDLIYDDTTLHRYMLNLYMFVECIDVHTRFCNHLDLEERAGCFS